MNGRIYDAKLGRFLQADPLIQAPYDTQSLNRYSYTNNNPLNAVDPSGFSFFKQLLSIVIAVVISVVTYGAATGWAAGWGFGAVGTVGNGIVAGAIAGAAAGFVTGVIATGSLSGGLKGAFSGALGGAIFGGLGAHFGEGLSLGKALSFGAAGGITSVIQGGKFGHGFIAAGVSAVASGAKWIKGQVVEARAMIKAVIGGTVSEITGGKFANGAAAGAFSELFTNGYETKSPEAKRAARASSCAYENGNCSGFTILDAKSDLGIDTITQDQGSGFQSKILRDDQGTIISYRGTDQGADWGENLSQATGHETQQYDLAIKLATDIKGVITGDLLLTGHSLGGGLASAAAIYSGTKAITFNAAGLSSRYGGGHPAGNQYIDAYYTSGDVLSLFQDLTPLPNAAGNRIRQAPNSFSTPLKLHSQL